MRIDDRSVVVPHIQSACRYPRSGPVCELAVSTNYTFPDIFSRSDIVVNKKDQTGFRPPSPYKASRRLITAPTGSARYMFNSRQELAAGKLAWETTFSYPYGSFISHKLPNSLEQALKVKALAEIKDQTINLAMTLAFLGQSASMVADALLKIRDVILAARKKDLRALRRLLGAPTPGMSLRTIAGLQLAYSFGWRQLVADLMGALEAFDKGLRKQDIIIYGRSRAALSSVLPVRANRIYTSHTIGDFAIDLNVDVKHSLSMIFQVENPKAALLSSIGLTNPLELAWDVIPWSFVVNWAIPIGDWLSSIDASTGLLYKGGTYTRTIRTTGLGTITASKKRPGDDVDDGIGEAKIQVEYFDMDRTVISSKVDDIYVKNPFDASLNRAIIASALLVQISKIGR